MLRAPYDNLQNEKSEVCMSFVPVAQIDEIPEDRGLRVRIEDIDVGLYRVGDRIFAMEDTCPHAGFPLSEGELEGCIITCKAHGWPFDIRTGFDSENVDGYPIPCFRVSIQGTTVHVDITDRTNDPRHHRNGRRARSNS